MATEVLYDIAVEPHGVLGVARNFGTLRDGGEFDSPYLRIMLWRSDKLIRAEMFELDDIDWAQARFEALRRVAAEIPA